MKQYKNVRDWQQHTANILGREQGGGIQPEYTAQMMLLNVSVSEDRRSRVPKSSLHKSSGFFLLLFFLYVTELKCCFFRTMVQHIKVQ